MTSVSRLELHNVMFADNNLRTKKEKQLAVFSYIKRKFEINNEEAKFNIAESKLKQDFFHRYFAKWERSCRANGRFLIENKKWLDFEIHFEAALLNDISNAGRKQISFSECSERSKRRKTEVLRQNNDADILAVAASMALRSEGNISAAKLVRDIADNSPSHAKNIALSWNAANEKIHRTYTAEEALAFLISNNFSKKQYISIQQGSKLRNCNIYPSYMKLLSAKKAAYPPGIVLREDICELPLQDLLNHTCERLLKSLELPNLNISDEILLYCEYGFYGSSGHSNYHQSWSESNLSDESLFLTSLVPLQLKNLTNNKILWVNPKPGSTRFCRLLRLQWVHETNEIIRKENEAIDHEISNLCQFENNQCKIKFSLHLTMVDNKVTNSLTNTSSMCCNICDATISEMNELDEILKKKEKQKSLEFHLPILHSYIHGIKELMENRKKIIQTEFLSQLSLRVDFPKPGFGTTNDGNTARRFFENSAISSEITGFNKLLIERFHIILVTISCGYNINHSAFNFYCLETARLYISLYPWYYMPPTVHKVLIHASSVIKNCILPIGYFSEEVLETAHKWCKLYRKSFSRKVSRLQTNEDIFNRILLHSDPFISLLNILPKKKKNKFPPEVLDMLTDDLNLDLNDNLNNSDVSESKSE